MKTLRTFAQVVELVTSEAARGNVTFARYSKGPAADRKRGWISNNYANFGRSEGGLSVNNLTDIKHSLRAYGDAGYIAQQLVEYSFLFNFYGSCYILTGEVVGWGEDGEPVVANVQPLAHVSPEALIEAEAVHKEDRPWIIREEAYVD